MVSTRQSSNSSSNGLDTSVPEPGTSKGKQSSSSGAGPSGAVSTRQASNFPPLCSISENTILQEPGPSKISKCTSPPHFTQEPGPSKLSKCTSPPHVSQLMIHDPQRPAPTTNLTQLPVELLIKIFGHLSYANIALIRLVCQKVNSVCATMLNSTFQRLQSQMLVRFQDIKSKMPRRESARRNHPLACESDIIETLHMRLTLLQMSFGKHIERKHCCFFPGEILDEVFRILHYIRVTPKLARPYKVTDELFDLSTMAMEYFKEKIEPTLPEITYFAADFLDFGSIAGSSSNFLTSASASTSKAFLALDMGTPKGDMDSPTNSGTEDRQSLPQSNMVLRKRISKIKQGMKRYNSQLSLMRRDLRNCKAKMAEQQKQILEYATRLDENDKKNEETSRKFSTLLQELNKCKTELQYWRSKSPANPSVCVGCGKVVAPVPTEDLQALANQGVVPEGLDLELAGSAAEPLDFMPIAGTSSEFPDNYWENGSLAEEPELDLKKDASTYTELKKDVSHYVSFMEDIIKKADAALSPKCAVSQGKRKSTDCMADTVQEPKKLRRVLKSRSKRPKIQI